MSKSFGESLRQKRTTQINQLKSHKRLILQKCCTLQSRAESKQQMIQKLQNNTKQLITQMINNIKNYGYAYFFTLFTEENANERQKNNYFSLLIRTIPNLIKNEKIVKQFQKDLWKYLNIIISQIQSTLKFLESFFQQGNQLKCILKEIKTIKSYLEENNIKLLAITISTIDQRFQQFQKLLSKLYEAKCRIQREGSQSTKKQSFLQAAYEILKIHPHNIFQEIFINRCKKLIQSFVPRKQSQAPLPYCCTLYFKKQSRFIKQQSKNHQHKNYHWPITLQKILKHVRKTIVGFLNLDGGIIYIGMKQHPQFVQSTGILLSQKDIVEFLQWLHVQCEFIYPKQAIQNQQKIQRIYKHSLENIKNRRLQKCYHYHVNSYVSVEFLPIIDPQTDLDMYQQEQTTTGEFRKLYLLKIKIKPGTKLQTFHLLKQEKQGQIQCYRRDDTSVKKLSQLEFMLFYNERIESFMKQTIHQAEMDWKHCPQCHFKEYCIL